jgi:2-methylisocitrate lyase-like PEP mutase family enzyme
MKPPTVGTPPVTELERSEVARVSVGGGPHRATMGLIQRIAERLRENGEYGAFLDEAMPGAEANRLFQPR